MNQRRSHPIAIAALCCAVSGCGDGSSGLSERQLVQRAQAICLVAQAAAGAMVPPSRAAGLDGTARYLARAAAIVEAQTHKLEALKLRPAARFARQWQQLISAEEAFTARRQRLAAAAASGDMTRLSMAEADIGPEQTLIRRATKLGVSLCAP